MAGLIGFFWGTLYVYPVYLCHKLSLRVPAFQEPVDHSHVLYYHEAAPGVLLPRGALRGRPFHTG